MIKPGMQVEVHVYICTCSILHYMYVYYNIPDVEVLEDLWIEVVNLSGHIQNVANPTRGIQHQYDPCTHILRTVVHFMTVFIPYLPKAFQFTEV